MTDHYTHVTDDNEKASYAGETGKPQQKKENKCKEHAKRRGDEMSTTMPCMQHLRRDEPEACPLLTLASTQRSTRQYPEKYSPVPREVLASTRALRVPHHPPSFALSERRTCASHSASEASAPLFSNSQGRSPSWEIKGRGEACEVPAPASCSRVHHDHTYTNPYSCSAQDDILLTALTRPPPATLPPLTTTAKAVSSSSEPSLSSLTSSAAPLSSLVSGS